MNLKHFSESSEYLINQQKVTQKKQEIQNSNWSRRSPKLTCNLEKREKSKVKMRKWKWYLNAVFDGDASKRVELGNDVFYIRCSTASATYQSGRGRPRRRRNREKRGRRRRRSQHWIAVGVIVSVMQRGRNHLIRMTRTKLAFHQHTFFPHSLSLSLSQSDSLPIITHPSPLQVHVRIWERSTSFDPRR